MKEEIRAKIGKGKGISEERGKEETKIGREEGKIV
jgi:hypothetical protein